MTEKEKELSAIGREQRENSRGRIARDSRERLKKIAYKKFRTCFIAAISEFETTFGVELWGHNLPEDLLTPQQLANKMRWEQIRKNILDKGNAQARALGMEIDLHNIEFKGYHMEFGRTEHGK